MRFFFFFGIPCVKVQRSDKIFSSVTQETIRGILTRGFPAYGPADAEKLIINHAKCSR